MDNGHRELAGFTLDDYFCARAYASQHRGEVAGSFFLRDVDHVVGHGEIIPLRGLLGTASVVSPAQASGRLEGRTNSWLRSKRAPQEDTSILAAYAQDDFQLELSWEPVDWYHGSTDRFSIYLYCSTGP